jgi:para-nitrobenzyl esterase
VNLDRLLVSCAAVLMAAAAGALVGGNAWGQSATASAAQPATNQSASSERAAQMGPVVSVAGGRVQGAILGKGGAGFKGIPFARPPIGDLRWREPQPVKPWSGLRAATKFGPMCAQKPSFIEPKAAEESSEDCLYLNIWNSEWPPTSRKAVMVWIPGGGNLAGTATDPVNDGESLARHGVVLVTINYRLGPLGFYSHPALTRESPHHSSGNQGILDQIAALKWVHENIAQFGGDPGDVTIFGESAGSLDVSVLMTTPLSKGLFRRAIGESGAVVLAGEPLTLSDAERRGEATAAKWKVPPTASTRDLRAVSVRDIMDADPGLARIGAQGEPEGFPNLGVTIDGYVFPKKPADVFAQHQEHRVDMLLGNNSREGGPAAPPADLPSAMSALYGPLSAQAQKLYAGRSDPDYGTPADQWATDTTFRCTAVAQLTWHAAGGNSAYEFEFARVPPGRESVGATHSSEVAYVFGIEDGLGLGGPGPPARHTAVDTTLAETMQQYWTNFAKTGDPNGEGLPRWPNFDPGRRAYIQFTSVGPVAKEGLRRAQCDLFIKNTERLKAK